MMIFTTVILACLMADSFAQSFLNRPIHQPHRAVQSAVKPSGLYGRVRAYKPLASRRAIQHVKASSQGEIIQIPNFKGGIMIRPPRLTLYESINEFIDLMQTQLYDKDVQQSYWVEAKTKYPKERWGYLDDLAEIIQEQGDKFYTDLVAKLESDLHQYEHSHQVDQFNLSLRRNVRAQALDIAFMCSKIDERINYLLTCPQWLGKRRTIIQTLANLFELQFKLADSTGFQLEALYQKQFDKLAEFFRVRTLHNQNDAVAFMNTVFQVRGNQTLQTRKMYGSIVFAALTEGLIEAQDSKGGANFEGPLNAHFVIEFLQKCDPPIELRQHESGQMIWLVQAGEQQFMYPAYTKDGARQLTDKEQ